jgi:plasmid stabilization system protein ParE
VGQRLRNAAELLASFPQMGRPGALAGTRELVVQGLPYLIVYRIEGQGQIVVLGVYHGAQKRPGED